MTFIKNIFWIDQERRLRMVWRLALQGFLMLLLLTISEIFLSLASPVIYGQMDPAGISGAGDRFVPLFTALSYLVRGLALALSIWLAGRLIDRRPFSDFGFRFTVSWWSDFAFGLGLGASLMSAIFLLELAAGWIKPAGYLVSYYQNLPFWTALLIPLIIFIAVGFYEELFSRGYQLTNLAEGIYSLNHHPQVALLLACLISSGFFGFIHAANPNSTLVSSLNISLAGIMLATGYLLTGELAIPVGLHISWNFFQGNVFGFPVSGGEFNTATIIEIQQIGPPWLTGGGFGPEGGLVGTFFTILGILLIILYVKKKTGSARLQTSITAPPALGIARKSGADGDHSPAAMQGIKHIIWDWNGTLLDDLDLCLETINHMLTKRGLDPVSRSMYLDVFGFPVKDYYQKIGFDFARESFEDISTEFITSYENGRPGCSLMEGAAEILSFLKGKGLSQSILSASKKEYLDQAIIDHGVNGFFSRVDGLDNHHAAGKLALAKGHLAGIKITPGDILLIGDTEHDAEIAAEFGMRSCLIPNGHHSRRRLEEAGTLVVDSIRELRVLL